MKNRLILFLATICMLLVGCASTPHQTQPAHSSSTFSASKGVHSQSTGNPLLDALMGLEKRDPVPLDCDGSTCVFKLKEVDEAAAKDFLDYQTRVAAAGKRLVIEINSPGGSVDDGFDIAKAIEASKTPVRCIIDGEAASMAAYILASCHERYATYRSSWMAHQASVGGLIQGKQRRFENIASRLAATNEGMIQHIGPTLKVGVEGLRAKIAGDAEWWVAGQGLLTEGVVQHLVHSVSEAR